MQRSIHNVIDYPRKGVSMPSNQPLLHLLVSPALIADLDDYRFDQRFSSRAAAITALLSYALELRPERDVAEAAKEKRYGKR